MQYTLVKQDGEQNVTVYISGRDPLMAHSTHPQWEEIVQRVLADDESVADLIHPAEVVAQRFEHLSERVTVANGRLYLDGDEMDNALTQQVLRFLNEGVDDWKPLVHFFEKIQANPTIHSREQLYTFLDANGMKISLTPEGDIVAYKGMSRHEDEESGEVYYQPTSNGHVIVDGVDYPSSADAKQWIGSLVEMPRSEVAHDPYQACSVGLHVATYSFARGYGSRVLEVHVNPRDVVSVPNEPGAEKVRCCRYRIIGEVASPYSEPVVLNEDAAPSSEHPTFEEIEEEFEGTIPSKAAFTRMATLAKSQRKSIKAVATTKKFDWIFVGEDQNDRESWRVP